MARGDQGIPVLPQRAASEGEGKGQPDCPSRSQSPHDETVVARCAL